MKKLFSKFPILQTTNLSTLSPLYREENWCLPSITVRIIAKEKKLTVRIIAREKNKKKKITLRIIAKEKNLPSE